VEQITALCRYRGIEPVITRDLIDAACTSYFVDPSPEIPVDELTVAADNGVGGHQPW
jgi:hypothetical protein